MKTNMRQSLIQTCLLAAVVLCAANSDDVLAAVHYVDLNSLSPTPPYTSWATAATNIQQAVNAATAGDEILVTNGIYATGGRAVYGTMTNRVAVDRPVTLLSVNGPQVTIIQGYQVPNTINGDGAIRCVYLTNGANLSGFTLTNGATRNDSGNADYLTEQLGGGLWCESLTAVVSNCLIMGNSGGGVYSGTLNNCTLTGSSGWGASGATLNNCMLSGNSGSGAGDCTLNNCILSENFGSGATGCALNNCTLSGNSGGGAGWYCTLNNCTLTGNSDGGAGPYCTLNNCILNDNSTDGSGGGASLCTLNNCTLSGNSADGYGGGAFGGTLNNCVLSGNSAQFGGGAGGLPENDCQMCYHYPVTLNNCTLTGNSAQYGGGAYEAALNNCIVYFNNAGNGANYDSGSTLNYCCSTSLPPGTGNISADPQLTDSTHLSPTSPCRTAGSSNFVSGVDIDGEPWASPPSIGCDEYYPGASGPLQVAVTAGYTNAATGFVVNLTGIILGHANSNRWDFGDGTFASNTVGVSHAWTNTGDHVVTLSAYNSTYPAGVSASVTIHVVAQPVHYVSLTSINPFPPYISWATAATNIQDAVDTATVAGALILVTNGTYATGGRAQDGVITNRVLVNKPLNLNSVNGPQFTVIDGGSAFRCAYLANGADLTGFTLTNGVADYGGGVWCDLVATVISNCVIMANSGGGAYQGTFNSCTLRNNTGDGADGSVLNNCTLFGNTGVGAGGSTLNNCCVTGNQAGGVSQSAVYNCTLFGNTGAGASGGILNNCTLSGNSNWGASGAVLNNCIIYFNTNPNGGNYDASCTLNYCCTTPLPLGNGNISADPQLTDSAHLGAGSPCVAAGSAAYTSGVDIDGQPWANPPSIGCDEFHPGAAFGPLKVSVSVPYTNVLAGSSLGLTALIEGDTAASIWDWGDGSFSTNEPFASHSWSSPGDYTVVLRAFNDSQPTGISATQIIHVIGSIRLLVPFGGDVASSADGRKLVTATGLYTSADSGATWIMTSVPPGGYGIASSADGVRLTTFNSYSNSIYGSTNSGGTWSPIGAPNWNSNYEPDFRGIAASADGNKLVAVSVGTSSNGNYPFFDEPIYTSTNFGKTWTTTSAPNEGWLAVASSADGTKLVAVAGVNDVSIGGTDGGPIYTSTNSGATWQAANAPIARWFCVASSADGNRLVAGAFGDAPGGGIYVSSNGGKDWTLTSAPTAEGWISVASSADGAKLVAVSEGLAVYEGSNPLAAR